MCPVRNNEDGAVCWMRTRPGSADNTNGLVALTCNTFSFNPITEPCSSVTGVEEPFAPEPGAATGLGRLFATLCLHGGRSQEPGPPALLLRSSCHHLSRLSAVSFPLRAVLVSLRPFFFLSQKAATDPHLQLKTGFGLSALVSECVYVGAHGCVNVPACVCTHVCACRCVSAHVGARGHPPVSLLGSHASCVFETRSLNILELA